MLELPEPDSEYVGPRKRRMLLYKNARMPERSEIVRIAGKEARVIGIEFHPVNLPKEALRKFGLAVEFL